MTRAVFDPITLRGLEIRNRLWIPPMCQYAVDAQDGVATDWHLMHLGSLARGGAGVVTVEATGVTPEGRISPQDLGLWNDAQRDALSRITDLIHAQGAQAAIQLAHAGRKASTWRAWGPRPGGNVPAEHGGWQSVGPSEIPFDGLEAPEALDAAGIDAVVAGFVAAARRAVDAGFDLLELHGAHGYLLHEFLSPLSNDRTDEYGGSLENRARLLLRVVDAVRAEVGEAVQIPVGPGYQLPFASAVRRSSGLPVAAVGMIDDPFQAEQIVALDQADVVLVGRESLRDPNFPIRTADALRYDMPYKPGPYERAYR